MFSASDDTFSAYVASDRAPSAVFTVKQEKQKFSSGKQSCRVIRSGYLKSQTKEWRPVEFGVCEHKAYQLFT